MSTIPVTVTVDTGELREWAQRHADAGHHGVAHVLYQAAEGIESIPEQHDRELREQVAREIEAAAKARRTSADATAAARGGRRDVHADAVRLGLSEAVHIARGERP